jgi:xanthine dehydrogenase accessory factor
MTVGLDDGVLEQAAAWHDSGQRVALATVIETWGSAPRPVGSQLAINESGEFVGSVSGGCVEADVIAASERIWSPPQPRLLRYGVSDERAWEVGLACGGQIAVYLQPLGELALALNAARAKRQIMVLVDGDSRSGAEQLWPAARKPVEDVVATGASRLVDSDAGPLFVQLIAPPLRLLVVGAGHIAQALVPMARVAGCRVTVVDPRDGFANPQRFPETDIVNGPVEQAMLIVQPDARSALVALAHDSTIDDPALIAALRSEAFYIGALGSRRTAERRRQRLLAAGFTDADVDRIRSPIGLDIGAQTPAEIALAALAEIIAALRGNL